MKITIIVLCLLLFCAAMAVATGVSTAVDVPAIAYTTPASHPCNIAVGNLLVCVTGEETHYKCEDKSRFLLTAEDGSKHCVSFKEISK